MSQPTEASLVAIKRLNHTIWSYRLKPEHYIAYQAGQYLQMHLPDSMPYYSIANAPSSGAYYDVHIRQSSAQLAPLWALGQSVTLSLPYGQCDLSHLQPQKPILFLAAGTGFVPIRAMIEQLLYQSDTRRIALYWGVANADDLYDHTSLDNWQHALPRFRYIPHIAQFHQPGLITRVLADHPNDLKDWQIVMAGPFDLMYLMRDILLERGLMRQDLFSDAFEFE
ncbi:MAG: NAD(P)H-flavin reductase [Legionella sp.]|nr:MAG: NAD(P)H-flavin reductase [Legionella sp.]